jgi:hypothetical protein
MLALMLGVDIGSNSKVAIFRQFMYIRKKLEGRTHCHLCFVFDPRYSWLICCPILKDYSSHSLPFMSSDNFYFVHLIHGHWHLFTNQQTSSILEQGSYRKPETILLKCFVKVRIWVALFLICNHEIKIKSLYLKFLSGRFIVVKKILK